MKRQRIIGQNVYRLRMKAGLTQTQLADFAELSKGYIHKIEHGKVNVTVKVVERLAGIFKCGWQDIVGEIESPATVARKR